MWVFAGNDLLAGVTHADAVSRLRDLDGEATMAAAPDYDDDGHDDWFVGGLLGSGRDTLSAPHTVEECVSVRFYGPDDLRLDRAATRGDFDGDGALDVAVAGAVEDEERVYVFATADLPRGGGVGAGRAWAATTQTAGRCVTCDLGVVDWDGDGAEDLAALRGEEGDDSWWFAADVFTMLGG